MQPLSTLLALMPLGHTHFAVPTQLEALVRKSRRLVHCHRRRAGSIRVLMYGMRGGRWQWESRIKVGAQGLLYIYVAPSHNIFLANFPMHDAAMRQT